MCTVAINQLATTFISINIFVTAMYMEPHSSKMNVATEVAVSVLKPGTYTLHCGVSASSDTLTYTTTRSSSFIHMYSPDTAPDKGGRGSG